MIAEPVSKQFLRKASELLAGLLSMFGFNTAMSISLLIRNAFVVVLSVSSVIKLCLASLGLQLKGGMMISLGMNSQNWAIFMVLETTLVTVRL